MIDFYHRINLTYFIATVIFFNFTLPTELLPRSVFIYGALISVCWLLIVNGGGVSYKEVLVCAVGIVLSILISEHHFILLLLIFLAFNRIVQNVQRVSVNNGLVRFLLSLSGVSLIVQLIYYWYEAGFGERAGLGSGQLSFGMGCEVVKDFKAPPPGYRSRG